MHDPDDSGTEPDSWLEELVAAFERLARSAGEEAGRGVIDYNVSVRSGIGGRDTAGDGIGHRPRRLPDSGRAQLPAHRVTTRTDEDELLVVADLPDVDVDAITVGFDDDTLVIGVDGRELERVTLPWAEAAANATIQNGILTVTIAPVDNE